jgi:hypothetical protein
VICIVLGKVFDAEIVDAETEFGGTSVVLPKASGVRARVVSGRSMLVDKVLVR